MPLLRVLLVSPRAFKCPGCHEQLANDEPVWLLILVSTISTALGFGILFVFLFFGWVGVLVSVVALTPLVLLPSFAGRLKRISDEEVARRHSVAYWVLGLLALAVIVAGIVDSI